MNIIEAKDLSFSYDFDTKPTLNKIDMVVKQGDFIAVLGCNASGKSTLIKLFNGLLQIQEGELKVYGIDLRDEKRIWDVRRHCAMVFQNPENQFISPIVEEDIAFGLRNYGVEEEKIPLIVSHALSTVGLKGFEKRFTYELSGGEKQRAAIAGALAISPEIMMFDEATSMLDPQGRKQVLHLIEQLNKEHKKTILMVTHYVEEAIMADRIVLMSSGKIIASGTPRSILRDTDILKRAGLTPPMPVRMYDDLKKSGIELGRCPITEEELVEEICRYN